MSYPNARKNSYSFSWHRSELCLEREEEIMNLHDEYEKIVQQRKGFDGDISYDDNPLILETVKTMTADIQKTIEFWIVNVQKSSLFG